MAEGSRSRDQRLVRHCFLRAITGPASREGRSHRCIVSRRLRGIASGGRATRRYKKAEREAKKNSDEAHGWKRAFQEKEDELQQGLQTVKQQQEQLAIKESELKSLHESLEPLLDMILEADEEAILPVLERVKSAPSRLSKYISDMAQVIVKNILSTIRVHMP